MPALGASFTSDGSKVQQGVSKPDFPRVVVDVMADADAGSRESATPTSGLTPEVSDAVRADVSPGISPEDPGDPG